MKSAADGAPTLGPTLCAFANMPEGRTIILGLDEAAGFVPVDVTRVAALEQAVSDQARTSVVPSLRCEFQTFRVSGKPVLVVEVAGPW
ncbi:Putative DNA-binding domain-containing protein [Tessaracoccus bendigoensis DSM 12906]|uniref:Putative DNA-binding domain-containing protein n=1 Tax=Tessaracoccus bendigoensis DSM 12906 TaxID=1123357 RepID=A0A1M6L255_9ACTN|nr:ATP-binding protein [Tessaracoccus bendigoensis]SHJ65192.1 Putative DNA-binding domain-containing protein [Tessaracoccus bendigoensis DSM 12906]